MNWDKLSPLKSNDVNRSSATESNNHKQKTNSVSRLMKKHFGSTAI